MVERFFAMSGAVFYQPDQHVGATDINGVASQCAAQAKRWQKILLNRFLSEHGFKEVESFVGLLSGLLVVPLSPTGISLLVAQPCQSWSMLYVTIFQDLFAVLIALLCAGELLGVVPGQANFAPEQSQHLQVLHLLREREDAFIERASLLRVSLN